MTDEKRFSGIEGTEYDLVARVAFQPALQAEDAIRDILSRAFYTTRKESIKVLELGCGTGITTEEILDAHPRIHVDAIDNEPNMVKQADERLHSRQSYWLRFNISEHDALKFVTIYPKYSSSWRNYDAVVSGFMIHNLTKSYRAKLYPAIFEVLRKGGIFINADKIAPDDLKEHRMYFNRQMKQFDKLTEMGRKDLADAWKAHYERDNKSNLKLTESELIGGLKSAGFSDISKVFRQFMEAVYIARKK